MDFLWMTEATAERFFHDVSQIEYSPENQLRNDFRSRDSWEMRLFDAWGHCFMGAAATHNLKGERDAWLLGTGAEVLHEGLSWITLNMVAHDSFIQDTFNQAVGRSIAIAHPRSDFARLSFDAMVQGRLDLTLAGISRGTVLRRIREAQREDAASVHQRMVQWHQRPVHSESRDA